MRDDLSHCKTPLVKGGQGRSDAEAEEAGDRIVAVVILAAALTALALIAWGLA